VPVDAGIDPWRAFDQVVCSLDAVKPVRALAGHQSESSNTTSDAFELSSRPAGTS
jgi:hypothetical protein